MPRKPIEVRIVHGIEVRYTDADSVRARFVELIALREARETAQRIQQARRSKRSVQNGRERDPA